MRLILAMIQVICLMAAQSTDYSNQSCLIRYLLWRRLSGEWGRKRLRSKGSKSVALLFGRGGKKKFRCITLHFSTRWFTSGSQGKAVQMMVHKACSVKGFWSFLALRSNVWGLALESDLDTFSWGRLGHDKVFRYKRHLFMWVVCIVPVHEQ